MIRLIKHKIIMNYLTYLLVILSLITQSCSKENLDDVPSYISIPYFQLSTQTNQQGTDSYLITDAWVYFDNDLQGVYPLPTTFPIVLRGKQNISIKAGIKKNGIAATRVNYPFYDYYNNEIELIQDSILEIIPDIKYTENANFHIIDFDNGINMFEVTNNSDTSFITNNTTNFEGKSGGVHISSPDLTFEVSTTTIDSLPRTGSPIYAELNYKCNTPFQVGVYANYLQSVTSQSLVTINPKDEWNKIYIDLTSSIINTNNATSHKIFISMRRELNSNDIAELYLDNFKIIY